jgi:hypothetical protein
MTKLVEIGEQFVMHYGVKGMHWGVRRSRPRPGANSERTRFKEGPRHLTEDELNARIQRMQIEKTYNSLNSRTVSVGERLASEITQNVGRAVITTVATGATLFAIKKGIEKKFGGTEAARAAASMITKRK